MTIDRTKKKPVHSGKIINISSQSGLFVRKGEDKLDSGDLIGALKLFRRALSCVPEDSAEWRDICLLLADTYLDMNCAVEAAEWVAPLLLPGEQEFRPAMLRLGHCLASRGELAFAIDAFDISLSSEPEGSPSLDTNDFMNALEASEFCERYLSDEAAEVPLLRDLDEVESERIANEAAALSDDSKFAEAIAKLEAAREKYPDSMRLFVDLLLDYYCEQRFEDALALYDSADEKFQNDFTVQCCVTMLCHQLSLPEREKESARRVSGYEISDPTEVVRAYTVMMETHSFEEALAYAERLTDMEPYNRTYLHFVGHAAYELGDYELAKSQYERSLIIEPHDAAASYYRGACEETLRDGVHRTFQIEYAVPHSEFIARCKYTEELLHCSKEELEARWAEESESILLMLDWALTDRNCPFGDLYLVLLMLLAPSSAARTLRRLLVEPDCSPGLRKLAASHLTTLSASGAEEFRFVMLNEGRTRICSVSESRANIRLPECYRYIINSVSETLGKLAPELVQAGVGIAKLYAFENFSKRPRLPYGQKEAMAAAIVFYALERSDQHETPDINEFAIAQGVTRRRLENAFDRLYELYEVIADREEGVMPYDPDAAPDHNEEDDDE